MKNLNIFGIILIIIVIGSVVNALIEGDVINQEKIDTNDPYFEFFDCRTEWVSDEDPDFYQYEISCLGLTDLGDGTFLVERENAPLLNFSKQAMVDCLGLKSELECIEEVKASFIGQHLIYFKELEISFDNAQSDKGLVLIDVSSFKLDDSILNPNKKADEVPPK